MKRDKSIILTEKQSAYVDGIMKGKDRIRAAADAGFASPAAHQGDPEKSVQVRRALAEARSELSSAAQISRADVIDGIAEAINLARLSADPATMIKGWSEIGKILGHYAPEVKKLEISAEARNTQQKLSIMSEQDLLDIITGRTTIDVTPETTEVSP